MNTENHYSETDLGNISIHLCGEYDPQRAYEYLDAVEFGGGSYICAIEYGKTITGIAPEPTKNTEYWHINSIPGTLTPEYIAIHDRVVNLSEQVEADAEEVRTAEQNVSGMELNVTQMHEQTRQSAKAAEQSKDSSAGYAASADASRQAAEESEQNINAHITGFDIHVAEKTEEAENDIEAARIAANKAIIAQQEQSVNEVARVGIEAVSKAQAAATSEKNAAASETAAKLSEENATKMAEQVATDKEQVAYDRTAVENAKQEMTGSVAQIEQNTQGISELKGDISKVSETANENKNTITKLIEVTTVDGEGSSEEYIEVEPTIRGNEGEAIASGGQLQTAKTGKIYNMYSVNDGETYYVSGMCNGYTYNGNHTSPLVVFKNDANTVVSFYVGTDTNLNVAIIDHEIIVPNGATKMYVNGTYQAIGSVNQSPLAKKRSTTFNRVLKKWSPLYGKSVYFVGDSVCRGAENATSYADLISEKYGMVMTKDGQNGTKLVTTDTKSICGRVQALTETFDYMIIEGGFNDMFASEPIGTLTNGFIGTNFDTTTVIGAVEKIFESMCLSNPEAKKLFVLTHRKPLANYWSGGVQKNYWDAIKSACIKWSVPYIDLSECCGLAVWGSTFEKYFAEPQGTHPLIEGYKKFYCPKIESAMEAL